MLVQGAVVPAACIRLLQLLQATLLQGKALTATVAASPVVHLQGREKAAQDANSSANSMAEVSSGR